MNLNPYSKGIRTFGPLLMVLISIVVLQGCAEGPRSGGGSNAVFDQTKLDAADVALGGRLYDNWWNAQNTPSTPPLDEQPLWSLREDPTVQQENSSSWRCKTCHGWDYQGADGSYSQVNNPSKYTGFPGLLQLRFDIDGNEVTPEAIFNFIKNGSAENYEGAEHSFGKYLSGDELHALTAFVIQIAWNPLGNPLSGSPTSGETLFLSPDQGCTDAGCHDTPDKQQLIRNVALENPEEFLHKVKFGQPGTAMMGGLNSVDAKHVLAFLRSGQAAGDIGNFSTVKYAAASLSKGGLIFDKWWETATNTVAPETDHPKWPAELNPNITGSSTWRCKQCHGWDYRGKDGVYADGKNYTGVKGIIPTPTTPVKYASAGEVYQFLKTDVDHAFGTILTEAEIYDATLFVMTMREDALAKKANFDFIDQDTKKVIDNLVDISNGEKLYHGDANSQTPVLCASCHGADGKLIDFGTNEFLSDVATDNPWEFIHKSRFGDISGSGQTMPAMVDNQNSLFHTPEAAADVLAYVQDAFVTKMDVAGRLYDNWAVEAKITNAPTNTNPIWASTGNIKKSGATTWRCKSCHGWDYLGSSGAYGDSGSSYLTGIHGLISVKSIDAQTLFNTIKSGAGVTSSSSHSFGTYLSDSQINLLVDFIKSDQGMRTFDAEKIAASLATGKEIYQGTTPGGCQTCHGADGTLLGEPIGNIARANIPEFLHKARFGHPNSIMIPTPGGYEGLQPQEAYDVLKYVETLGADNTTPDPGYASASIVRGGRLFDKWWEEMKAADETAAAPTQVNPHWELRHSSIPDLAAAKKTTYSWRCKTCHGWDYEGIGFNSGLKSAAGADNLIYKLDLIKTSSLSPQEQQKQVFDWIKLGVSSTIHNFSSPRAYLPTTLGDVEIWDLVKYLMEGVVNTDTYIYESFRTVKGPYRNPTNGQGLYFGTVDPAINCASCHGEDGKGVVGKGTETVDIFEIANSNPWEFLHKTRFGQPNTAMPAFLDPSSEHSTVHALHVLDFAQQEFQSRPGVALQ